MTAKDFRWRTSSSVRLTSQSITQLSWNYRAARAIAVRNDANTATTEDLRQAIIHYRILFDDLLEAKPSN